MSQTASEPQSPADASTATTVREGYLLDYVSQTEKKETPKERVRQRVARGIVHELHISPDDMATDVSVSYTDDTGKNRRKKVDLVIYGPGSDPESARHRRVERVVLVKSPPNVGKRSVAKLRDHQQAAKDLDELKDVMSALPNCTYGMWTNGLDFFHLKKEEGTFEDEFKPLAFWPQADETFSIQDHASTVRLRSGDAETLKTAFRRCHNFIHGNEGMPKDAAFWQFLYLIFSKIHDESRPVEDRRFVAGPMDQFSAEGQQKIRDAHRAHLRGRQGQVPRPVRGQRDASRSPTAPSPSSSPSSPSTTSAAPPSTSRALPTKSWSAPTSAATAASTSLPSPSSTSPSRSSTPSPTSASSIPPAAPAASSSRRSPTSSSASATSRTRRRRTRTPPSSCPPSPGSRATPTTTSSAPTSTRSLSARPR